MGQIRVQRGDTERWKEESKRGRIFLPDQKGIFSRGSERADDDDDDDETRAGG